MVDVAAKARVHEALLMWSPQWDSTPRPHTSFVVPRVAYEEEKGRAGGEGEGRKMREKRVPYDGKSGAYPPPRPSTLMLSGRVC